MLGAKLTDQSSGKVIKPPEKFTHQTRCAQLQVQDFWHMGQVGAGGGVV